MPDSIAPPVARRPEEAVELVCQAFSDGDIEAAVAQYECGAQLHPGAWPVSGVGDLAAIMSSLMALRLPMSIQIRVVLRAHSLAVVTCDRRIAGTGPDCEPVQLSGHGFAAIRPQADGTWRIAADTWCLANEIPLDPPAIPLSADVNAVSGEGPGRATSTAHT
jgi:ketosteroid isomerase-like protein